MASKRFCDICDALLTTADDQPFIRDLAYAPPNMERVHGDAKYAHVLGYISITNENNHPLTDVCNGCKLKIVNEGQPTSKPNSRIATLQQPVAADSRPGIQPFRLPEKPPTAPPPPKIEPSLQRAEDESIFD
jgi:hypothetical protein